jgi:hypothetical protein
MALLFSNGSEHMAKVIFVHHLMQKETLNAHGVGSLARHVNN